MVVEEEEEEGKTEQDLLLWWGDFSGFGWECVGGVRQRKE